MSQHQYELLHRLRRIEGTFRWIDVTVKTAQLKQNTGSKRSFFERSVQYTQKALKNGELYGRRYAATSETIQCVQKGRPYHQRSESYGMKGEDERKIEQRVVVALQGAPRELRNALCGLIYYDIDFFCSFPQLVWSLLLRILRTKPTSESDAIRTQTTVLEQYVCSEAKREQMLQNIMHHHQIEVREVAKKLPLVLLHGGAYSTWSNNVLPANSEPYPPMVEFAASIKLIVSMVLKSGEEGMYDIETKMVGAREELRRKEEVFARTDAIDKLDMRIFSLILHSYEDVMLRVVVDTFTREKWTVGSLQFDGIYVEATDDEGEIERLKVTMGNAGDNVTKLVGDTFTPSLVLKPLYKLPCKSTFEDWATAHYE